MSYVVEAAIGIDDKSATATRGWFRIDPASCRVVAQGTLTADRILLHARALGLYGSSPMPQSGADTLCIARGEFRHRRRAAMPLRPDAGAVHPDQSDARPTTAISSPISPRTASMTTSRRGLPASSGCWSIAGYDAAPIDGVDGPKTQAALNAFLKSRGLPADAVQSPNFFTT